MKNKFNIIGEINQNQLSSLSEKLTSNYFFFYKSFFYKLTFLLFLSPFLLFSFSDESFLN